MTAMLEAFKKAGMKVEEVKPEAKPQRNFKEERQKGQTASFEVLYKTPKVKPNAGN